MPPKAPRWSKKASTELEKQFNLFTQSGGEEGFDPRDRTAEYIKSKAQGNPVLKPYLAGKQGGFHSHRDSAKIIRGYERVSSEYFVKLAKAGIRRSTLTSRTLTCSVVFLVVPPAHLIFSIFHCSFMFTEAYLEDKGLFGKRKAGEEAEEASDDDEDEAEESPPVDDSMKNKARKTKTPEPKTTPGKEDDDVDGLADDVQSSLNLSNWFIIDRSQQFGIFAYVFLNPIKNQRYVYIRIELVGSIDQSMLKSKFINNGDTAVVTIKFRKGGELTNPEHCLIQYRESMSDELLALHPIYAQMMHIHRYNSEVNEEEEVTLSVDLPFRCDPRGFYDPIKDDEGFLDLGIFPLLRTKENVIPGAPPPSTKFLHLVCEELAKPKVDQKFKTRTYFLLPPAEAKAGADLSDDPNMMTDNEQEE